MIRYEYETALVEEAVFLSARRNAEAESALRASLEPNYAIADAHERDASFRRAYGNWFNRLRLDRAVPDLVAEHSSIIEHVARCLVRRSPGRRKQSVELFVNRGARAGASDRTLVMEICSETLVDRALLASFLRRELLKTSDMLDDAFGYAADLPDASATEENLIRDRYRALWDIYVEKRLFNAQQSAQSARERARRSFERAFTFRGVAPAGSCFDQIWELNETTHQQLLAWASKPDTLPGWVVSRDATALRAGMKCPLCDFPTFDWYSFDPHADTIVIQNIRAARPQWRIGDGACRQCVETYAASIHGDALHSNHAPTTQASVHTANLVIERN